MNTLTEVRQVNGSSTLLESEHFLARQRFYMRLLRPTLAVLMVVTLLPTIYLLVTSLTPLDLTRPETAWNFATPLNNYELLLEDGRLHDSFWTQAKLSFWTVGLQLLLGFLFALLLNSSSRLLQALRTVFLIPMVLPPIAFTIPYFLVYRHLELLDTLTGLIIIHLTFNISLVVWLMRSFFDATPRSLEEAAWIDGATLWQGFTRIILPLSGPGLAATAILCFLYSWNDFFFALILTRTEAMTAGAIKG